MTGSNRCSVGVDVSESRGLDVVVLGGDRRLPIAPLPRQSPADLTRLLGEWAPVVVAIDSPPCWGTAGTSRRAERELAALGVSCFRTPSDPEQCARPFYRWMRAGHAAFAAATEAGYRRYEGGESVAGCALEVFPHAVAVSLAGARPPAGLLRRPAEKRRWRTAVLAAHGVEADGLPTLDAVDAALAALGGLLAAEGRFFALGAAEDGYMVVPGERPSWPWD